LSDKPVSSYSSDEMAADMVALLDHLKIPSAIVVGHSMGGHIAGTLAAKYPQYVKAVALLDKSANGPEKPGQVEFDPQKAIDPVTKDWPLPFTSLTEARQFIHTAMESELSYQYFMNSLVEEKDGYRMMFSTQAMAANIASYRRWYDLLPAIKCPVLLVRSGSHEAVPDEDWLKMRSLLPGCLAFEMSEPDHNVQLSNKTEFYGYFDHFLEKCAQVEEKK
jgi:2-succinyl-6-hydroxy-2,4-cyclohexadiene-1-carboxylate synthase